MKRRQLEYLRYLFDMGEPFLMVPQKAVREKPRPSEVNGIVSGKDSVIQQDIDSDVSAESEQKSPQQKEMELREFYQQVKGCTKCALSEGRTKLVFGAGSANAGVMFIGEAPGVEEDRRGIPFIGRAGKLLDKILAAAGLERDEVYIANVLKCRPPENRDPLPSEERMCLPYLHRQIELIQPRVICCLGRVAAHALLGTKEPMKNLRGIIHKFRGIPMLVTYHPAALLRSDRYRRPTWEDFQILLQILEEAED